MDVHDIQNICRQYTGVTEDIKWQDHLCFNVGGKMFLITSPDAVPVAASLKVSSEIFDDLIEKDGFMPAPYLARYKWVWIDDITRLSLKEWEQYIDTAYRLVALKLPRRIKQQIGL